MKRGVIYATAALVLLNLLGLVYVLFRGPGPADGASSAGSTQQTARVESSGGTTDPAPIPAPGQHGVYSVTGVVRELRPDGTNIVIRHETVPGYMPAMTMPFTARDPRQIASLQPGDKVTFRLLVTDEESWIDSVQRVGGDRIPEFTYEQARIVRDVEPLEPGDVVPDYPFTNELGKVTRLSDFRGKVVGLTFMFTRCPLPEFCPRMLRNFETAQETLKGQNAFTNWHLVALTIDPKFDTPAALRAHGQTYGYDPERWTFLTGALIDIDAIAEQAGILYRRQTPDALPDHNLRTLVIDAEGRLRKTFIGNTWKPEELVEEMQAALAPFEDAPEKETFE